MATRVIVVVACALALVPSGAVAQSVGGGVKAGVALGDVPKISEEVDDLQIVDTTYRTGFAVGGFIAWRFDSGFAIQPEVLYTQKGVKVTAREAGVSADLRVKTDFLDVPVLARYTFGKVVRGYVFAGPSFDFKMSAKMEVKALGTSEEEDLSEDVESFEFAFVFGGGVEFGPVLLEARWSEGLTDLGKEAAGEPSVDIKSRTFLILGGLRF